MALKSGNIADIAKLKLKLSYSKRPATHSYFGHYCGRCKQNLTGEDLRLYTPCELIEINP